MPPVASGSAFLASWASSFSCRPWAISPWTKLPGKLLYPLSGPPWGLRDSEAVAPNPAVFPHKPWLCPSLGTSCVRFPGVEPLPHSSAPAVLRPAAQCTSRGWTWCGPGTHLGGEFGSWAARMWSERGVWALGGPSTLLAPRERAWPEEGQHI